MKAHKIMLIGFFVFFATSALAESQALYKTQALRKVCGNSQQIWDYIVEMMGENQAVTHLPFSACSSESGRRLVFYSDGSWFVTKEKLGDKAADDETCIVGIGDKTQSEAIFECGMEFGVGV